MHRTTYKDISIIIPFYNEEGNVGPVLREVMERVPGAEIVAVDDGSTDCTASELRKFPTLRVVTFFENLGQGFAIYAGLELASNESCVMMDGDGQFDPIDIPLLAKQLENAHLVTGWRKNRRDNSGTILVSKFANMARRQMLGDEVRDTGSIKAVRRSSALTHLYPFEGMHRYIPSIFSAANLKVKEMPVNHRQRLRGKSKYSHAGRAWRGIIDLMRMRTFIRNRYAQA